MLDLTGEITESGEQNDLIRMYTKRHIQKTIEHYTPFLKKLEKRYSVPVPFIQAVLHQEMESMDLLDPVADLVVRRNLSNTVKKHPKGMLPDGYEKANRFHPLRKMDSSTGYAQIYAFVAINAINFAVAEDLTSYKKLGIPAAHTLHPRKIKDLWRIWRRLNREPKFNIEIATLNLLAAAKEKTGKLDFAGYTPEEIKRIYTRYNGTSPTITKYGEEAYRYYQYYSNLSSNSGYAP